MIIRHKFEKLSFVSNALSRLFIMTKFLSTNYYDDELDVLFTTSVVQMNFEFRNKFLQKYVKNATWNFSLLISKKNNNTEFSFVLENDLIYRKISSDNMSFEFKRLCVFAFLISNILSMIHDVNHSKFDWTYQQTICSWYIQNLIKQVKVY